MTSLSVPVNSDTQALDARLRASNAALARRYPGDRADRQPVHTVYGGAHLFKHDAAKKLGGIGLRALDQYAPDAGAFAEAVGLAGAPAFARTIYERVREKLEREPIEDFRIDFEDGYGNRPDAEEDGHAVAAAEQTAKGMADRTLPPFVGVRIKPLTDELWPRARRTLDLYLTALAEQTKGALPANFVVNLPKISTPDQVRALSDLMGALEEKVGLAPDALRIELMIETTQAIFGPRGEVALPALAEAGGGRVVAAHFGTYDYTASCNITAAHQTHTHPACDFARHVMQVALGGTGVWLSDGATTVMPVAPHRADPKGAALSAAQLAENRRAVHAAWHLHYQNVWHSLVHGYYQGWDLHPGQLPIRYAAVYAFFLGALEDATVRLKNFVDKAAQATLSGSVFDDAATGQGLLNFFLRGIACGALREEEATKAGVTLDEVRSRSFLRILENRRR